jgi:hypothetical protein
MNSDQKSSEQSGIDYLLSPENLAHLPPEGRRKLLLYMSHPEPAPEFVADPPYFIHPPTRLSSTASWILFRDKTLLPAMLCWPDEPNLPNFLKQVEMILAWRAAQPPENRFWKPDKSLGVCP